jgi:histidyl-tRNA synthetase
MSLNTQPYKGARDFYPEDKQVQNYIFGVMRDVAKSYGYQEYDAPILEPTDLYKAKGSEEIVNEQTYTFEDRGGRSVTIRTEMTPSVSRMVAGRRQELAYPVRWFSIPGLWRYERPQRGRLREFWQLNVDIFGVPGIEADHEIISVADSIMQAYGASRDMYVTKISSRKLLEFTITNYLGVASDKVADVIRLLDRVNKLEKLDFSQRMAEIIDNDKQVDTVLLKLWDLIENSNNIDRLPEELKAHDSYKELKALFRLFAKTGILNAEFDITLTRGFDYYTDIVFEVFDLSPENNRSLFGGGRYDGLVGLFGVEPVPTVGFGMGDVTIKDFLETHKLLPKLPHDTQLCVLLVGDTYVAAQPLLSELRSAGLSVAVDSSGRKIDKQLKSAVKAGYQFVLFAGEQELDSGEFKIKNLETGQEQVLPTHEIAEFILNDSN